MTDKQPELSPDSFLAILFNVLAEQDEDIRNAFFTCPKEELIKAYNLGKEAGEKKFPQSANPFKPESETAYSPYLAWSEGWMNTQLDIGKLLQGL